MEHANTLSGQVHFRATKKVHFWIEKKSSWVEKKSLMSGNSFLPFTEGPKKSPYGWKKKRSLFVLSCFDLGCKISVYLYLSYQIVRVFVFTTYLLESNGILSESRDVYLSVHLYLYLLESA